MENMKWEDLTPEQQEQIKKLAKDSRKRGAFIGIKMGFLFIGTNFLITVINGLYVQSQGFGILAGLMNGFMLYSVFKGYLTEERDRVQAEVKKVLQK